jgi:Domain of unknown function (DUF4410)
MPLSVTTWMLAAVCIATTQNPSTSKVHILRDVKVVQVTTTVVANPDKVKEESAPAAVQEMLQRALRTSNFEVGDAPISAHIVLEEFSSGSTAKRMLVGFGSGRSTVAGRLVFCDAEGKELANVKIKSRGELMFSSYQGDGTQRKQAVSSFERTLAQEIAKLK